MSGLLVYSPEDERDRPTLLCTIDKDARGYAKGIHKSTTVECSHNHWPIFMMPTIQAIKESVKEAEVPMKDITLQSIEVKRDLEWPEGLESEFLQCTLVFGYVSLTQTDKLVTGPSLPRIFIEPPDSENAKGEPTNCSVENVPSFASVHDDETKSPSHPLGTIHKATDFVPDDSAPMSVGQPLLMAKLDRCRYRSCRFQ